MKKFFGNKANWIIISTVSLVVVLPIVVFLGFSYLAPLALIVAAYYYTSRANYEIPISPKEFEMLKEYLHELEQKALFIREHLEEYGNDLQAKFELREIEKEIEETKKEMGL